VLDQLAAIDTILQQHRRSSTSKVALVRLGLLGKHSPTSTLSEKNV
jgi:hypothetical protein